jgi:hypothetical protein
MRQYVERKTVVSLIVRAFRAGGANDRRELSNGPHFPTILEHAECPGLKQKLVHRTQEQPLRQREGVQFGRCRRTGCKGLFRKNVKTGRECGAHDFYSRVRLCADVHHISSISGEGFFESRCRLRPETLRQSLRAS